MGEVHAYDSIPESVRRLLEERITTEGLQPGDRLGLKSELQQEFGVAGPTLDQALKLLVSDGMVTVRRGPGGGVFVARSHPVLRLGSKQLWARDPQTLVENIELREALTSLLGVSAARTADRDQNLVRELAELATALDTAPIAFDTQRLIWRGHELLVELSDSAALAFIYQNLLDAARSLIVKVEFPSNGPEADRERRRISAHRSLFQAVVDGDVEAANECGLLVRNVSPLGRDGHLVTMGNSMHDVQLYAPSSI